jgi:hypothetical protein
MRSPSLYSFPNTHHDDSSSNRGTNKQDGIFIPLDQTSQGKQYADEEYADASNKF